MRKKTVVSPKSNNNKKKIQTILPSSSSPSSSSSPLRKSFQSDVKYSKKTPLTTDGFEGYVIEEKKSEKGKEKKQVRISHAAGPITNSMKRIHTSIMGQDRNYEESIINNWIPHSSLSVVDEISGTPLTAKQVDTKYDPQKNLVPQYFVNPMADLDYIVFEAILKNTFVGPLMNSLTKFIIGTGFRPELELINPNEDSDKNQIEIDSNQEIIETLMKIDNQLNYDDNNLIDVSFTDKVSAMVDVTNSFNRSALMFSYDKPVEVNGIRYKEIPSSLKFAHARDLGVIKVEPNTWRLEAVQWRQAYYMVPAKDMIYLWNPLISAKYHNAWLYGGSMILPMLDASRVIRRIIGVDFGAMAEATWAGMFILAVKPEGQDESQKIAEFASIANNMVRGGPNILMEDPANISFNTVDYAPKVTEFKDLTEFLIKYCVASLGLPHTMFFDEATSNRSTMLGKIQLAISTVINPMRESIGRQISSQWYQRWFRLIYHDSEKGRELLEKFRIKMVFNDLHIDEWFDKIEAVNEVDARKKLSDVAYGELSGIENYQNKVESDAETIPGGDNKTFKFGDNENGFDIKHRSRKREKEA